MVTLKPMRTQNVVMILTVFPFQQNAEKHMFCNADQNNLHMKNFKTCIMHSIREERGARTEDEKGGFEKTL